MIVALVVVALAVALAVWLFADDLPGTSLCVLLLAAVFLVAWSSSHYHERTITCHVTDKDRAGGYKGSSSMRVYTDDCGTLENQDSWLRGKTDSADVWQKIHPGQTQTFRVVGWRFSPFSQFPNILSVETSR